MNTKLVTNQTQKAILTPAMQQSIEILLLPLLELRAAIEQELQDNPLLEVNEEDHKEDSMDSQIDEVREQMERLMQASESYTYENRTEEEFPEDRNIKIDDSLEESLLRQLRVEFSDPLQQKIGELIIGNIDEDGYLTMSIEEIARMAETDDVALVEKILHAIQHFEPLAIAARSLQECLTIQLQSKKISSVPIIQEIVNNHLAALGQRKYGDIAKQLNISTDQVKKIAEIIATLEPKPARNYRPIRSNIYIKPDLFIIKNEESGYQIYLNDEDLPLLRVNSAYKNMLKQYKLSLEEKTFIREKLKNAIHFIKSIEQRGHTIMGIAKFILNKQKDFFEKGQIGLVPMTLKDIAQELQRNESTISRAIANKYIATPQGLYSMKSFFSHGIEMPDTPLGEKQNSVSSRTIQEEIKDLIENEDKNAPLSDQDIENYFLKKGTKIARRTISKYRQILDILPSHLRKQRN